MKGITTDSPLVVGESWEISVEPSFPSALDGGGALLFEVIAADPDHWLGADASLGNTSLLVKLLDTDDALSVQIHPSDDYPSLAADESGKPESWYIVAAEAGAGIYLGLEDGVTSSDIQECLGSEGNLAAMLTFVEVTEGDFFVIDAGTAHAIGPGLTLVEPQRVLPGRRGLTYRYWDWNRRYDDEGKQNELGQPRALDVADAIATTRFDHPRGHDLVQRIRRRAGSPDLAQPAQFIALSDPEALGAIRFAPLSVGRIAGDGKLTLPPRNYLRSITVVAGNISVEGQTVSPGRSAVLAADGHPYELDCTNAHAVVSAAHTG